MEKTTKICNLILSSKSNKRKKRDFSIDYEVNEEFDLLNIFHEISIICKWLKEFSIKNQLSVLFLGLIKQIIFLDKRLVEIEREKRSGIESEIENE